MESNFKNNPKNRLQSVSLVNALNSAILSEYPVSNISSSTSKRLTNSQYLEKSKKS